MRTAEPCNDAKPNAAKPSLVATGPGASRPPGRRLTNPACSSRRTTSNTLDLGIPELSAKPEVETSAPSASRRRIRPNKTTPLVPQCATSSVARAADRL
jgi:hypothetical protein